MRTDPAWMHFTAPRAAHSLAELLMRLAPSERPDALFIADDNLVARASAGLLAAGVKVGKEIGVVGHCNFPWPTPALVPTRRLGWEVRGYLNMMIDVIDRQVRGEECPPLIEVPPVFEDEAG